MIRVRGCGTNDAVEVLHWYQVASQRQKYKDMCGIWLSLFIFAVCMS